ncbi:putative membrane protein [Mucilaginibacter sp. UYNi724]
MFLFSKRSNAEAAVTNLLRYLKVAIDPETVIDELEKHPDYPSMLAVSDVLTALHIENSAFRAEFEILGELSTPFLVNLNTNGGEFAVVTKMDAKHVYFSDERKEVNKLGLGNFKLVFEGVALIAEPDKKIIKNGSLLSSVYKFKPAVLTAGCLLIFLTLLSNSGYFSNLNWLIALLAIIKTGGLIASILLLVQSVDSNNPLIQVLCQGGDNTDCNAILSSKAAKVFDGLTWSEVGFFYFAGSWMLLQFGGGSPPVLTVLAILNFLSLPYTVYSIYYQARVAKKWCILCCTIQVLLWLEFLPLVINAATTHFYFSYGNYEVFRLMLICFLTPILLWLMLRPIFFKLQQLRPLKEQLRKFKYNSELFNQVLSAQPQFKQPDENWSIILGKAEANNVITMVTNPYCQPCAKMHKVLSEIINQNGDVQARIVFTAQNTDSDQQTPVTRHLMALNALLDKTQVKNALHDWYEQKQKDYEAWAKAHPVTLVETDYYKLDAQKAWCEMAEVAVTPTMLINGHLLPSTYQLTDLKYMLQ